MNRKIILALSTILLANVSACGGDVRDSLGLKKKAPDEFMVVSSPPLTVPPDFSLSSPVQDRIIESKVTKDAEEALFTKKEDLPPIVAGSKAEAALLQQAETKEKTSNIRQVIDEENRKLHPEANQDEEDDPGFFSRIIDRKEPEPIVNPNAEEDRIKKNKEEDKPITEGETPTRKPRSREGLIKF